MGEGEGERVFVRVSEESKRGAFFSSQLHLGYSPAAMLGAYISHLPAHALAKLLRKCQNRTLRNRCYGS
jgi:hypothetical protein